MFAWEQFHKATLALVQQGSIKRRLVTAYTDLLEVKASDLPEEIHGDFRRMNQELTRVAPYGDENAVCATVRKMSVEEANRWASTIVAMYDAVSRSFNSTGPLVAKAAATNGHNGKKHRFHIA